MHTYTPIFIVMDHIDTVEVYRFHKYKNLFLFIYFDIQLQLTFLVILSAIEYKNLHRILYLFIVFFESILCVGL